jgi:hypothetical protein
MKKTVSLVLCLAATIYTIWYMHFGVPYKNSGALSKIGIEHKALFVIWGVLTFAALAYSTAIAYIRYLKTKVYIPLLTVAGIGMALILAFDFDYSLKPDYYLHCTGSLAFSVIMGTTLFLLFLLNYKKSLMFKIFTYFTAAILLIDLALLIIIKENALIEALPIFAAYIMLTAVNMRREKVEIKR